MWGDGYNVEQNDDKSNTYTCKNPYWPRYIMFGKELLIIL
jgi:hypothetical protein